MAGAMVKLTRIIEAFPEADRRTLAYEVWRSYGGPLTGTERSRTSRERRATLSLPDATINGAVSLQNAAASVSPGPPSSALSERFKIPASVETALGKSRILGSAVRLKTAEFWQAEVRANPGVNFAAEILKAEAWMAANPERAPRKNFARFLHTWLGRAERSDA